MTRTDRIVRVVWTWMITSVLSLAAVPAQAASAVAGLHSCTEATVTGHARLTELPSTEGVKSVLVRVTVQGLSDGRHAVHLHETGACEPCAAAGGHFDPGPYGNSGAPPGSVDANHPYHSGDLRNVEVRDGHGVMVAVTSRVTLSPGPLSLFDGDGSALVIHVNPDTYCPDGEVVGCAGGGRAACGVLVWDEDR